MELTLEKLKSHAVPLFEFNNNTIFPDLKTDSIEKITKEFIEIFPKRPLKNNIGGAGLIPSYLLFLITRLMNPSLIVESGVWRGHTAWVFRKASPNAEIHTFDISLKNLEVKDESIFFHEHDWTQWNFRGKEIDNSIIFFDDHMNQAKRVREAYKKGFKWLIFDDNVPVDLIFRVGKPPIPMLSMLFDKKLKEGDNITWELKGQTFNYKFSQKDTYNARKLIARYVVFPTFTNLTLVKLKD